MAREIVMGREFIQALIDQGVIPNMPIRRVIIDAGWKDALTVYVETFGGSGLLDFQPPDLSEAKIVVLKEAAIECVDSGDL